MIPRQQVLDGFLARFGTLPPLLVRAPGRVNLIGEHTDYNDGFVFPMAIDRAVWIALRPRKDRRVVLFSVDFNNLIEFSLDSIVLAGDDWGQYVQGVAWALQLTGYRLSGWEGVLASDVPVGAGLSSSAALELAVARAFHSVGDYPWDGAMMAMLARRAENEFVGVSSGIMDQMISALGRAGHAMLLDCRKLQIQHTPLPSGTAVLVLDTSTRRGLVDSAYNERVAQCQAASAHFRVKALRDVSLPELYADQSALDPIIFRRARHIVSENERTLAAAEAMRAGNPAALGALMDQSHSSLRDDYQVSRKELDHIVAITRAQPGCYGARMTGAGFGGCAVALVAEEAAQAVAFTAAEQYFHQTGLESKIYQCRAADGAALEPV